MAKESDHELTDTQLAQACGWSTLKWGWDGYPDRMYFKEFYFFAVERKMPGKKLRPNQVARHKELKAKGISVHVIDDKGTLEQMQEVLVYHEARFSQLGGFRAALEEIAALPGTRQDEACCLALGALDAFE